MLATIQLSDLVCCGTRHVDLHALVNHHEEVHMQCIAPNGKKNYPAERLKQRRTDESNSRSCPGAANSSNMSSAPTTPSSSRSSSVASSPPTTPITPAPLPLEPVINSPEIDIEFSAYLTHGLPFNGDVISAFGPEYDFTKDYASYERSFTRKLNKICLQQDQTPVDAIPAEVLIVKSEPLAPTPFPAPAAGESTAGDPTSVQRKPTSPTTKKNPKVRAKDVSAPAADAPVTNDGGKVVKSKAKVAVLSNLPGEVGSSVGRKREKTHRCPVSPPKLNFAELDD